jgi:hypothetical protein
MNRPITASWILSAEELSVALKLHVLQSNLGIALQASFGIACLAIAVGLLFIRGPFHWQAWLDTAGILAASFVLWGLVFSQGMVRIVMLERLRGWPDDQKLQRLTISEESIVSQCGERSISWRWEMIRKVVGTRRGALLYPRVMPRLDLLRGMCEEFVWLPRRAFRGEEEYLGFLALAKAKAQSFQEVNA